MESNDATPPTTQETTSLGVPPVLADASLAVGDQSQACNPYETYSPPAPLWRQFASLFYNFHESRLRAGWRILTHLVVVALLFAILVAIIAVVSFFPEVVTVLDSQAVQGTIQSVIMIGGTVLCFWLIDRRTFWKKPDGRWWSNFSFGMFLGAAAMAVIFAVEWSLGWVTVEHVGVGPTDNLISFLTTQFGYIVLFTMVAFGEEFLSRGYHLKNMSEGLKFMGPIIASLVAIFLSSALFGALHLSNPNSTWVSTVGITLAGIMLAFGRVCTGSLAAPIGVHLTWNYFQGAFFGFPVSGQAMDQSVVEITQLGPTIITGGEFGPEAGLIGAAAILLMMAALWFWTRSSVRSVGMQLATLSNYKKPRTNRVPACPPAQ